MTPIGRSDHVSATRLWSKRTFINKYHTSFFITPCSRFDNTLNFDITLTPNGVIVLWSGLTSCFTLQSLFACTLVCQIKESLQHGSTSKTRLHKLDVPDVLRLETLCSTQYHPDCWNLAELGSFWCYNLGYHFHWPPSMRWHAAVDISQW